MQNKQLNITLIGMPASGKSTLGKALAANLGWRFCDTDSLIESSTGLDLQQIVDEQGYLELRRIEERVILGLDLSSTVIATGGSAVYSAASMSHLGDMSRLVYLQCGFDELVLRLGDFSARGLAKAPDQNLQSLFDERAILYAQYAEISFDTTRLDLKQAVSQLHALLADTSNISG